MIGISRTHQLGGIAFVLGNLLFLVNKVDEMSRLFLGRWMPDLLSGENAALILLGQVALSLDMWPIISATLELWEEWARTRCACSAAAVSCL